MPTIETTYKCKKCGDEIPANTDKNLVTCKCGTLAVDGCEGYVRLIGKEEDYEIINKNNMNIAFNIFPRCISSDSAVDKINVETEFPEKYLQEYAENNPDVDIDIYRTDKVREMPDLVKRIDDVVASFNGRIVIRL